MRFNSKLSNLFIRIGIGFVFFYFGIDKFFHTQAWMNWIPPKLTFILPISAQTFTYILGVIEMVIGLFVFIGFFTRIFATIASVILLAIIVSIGFNEVAARDITILITTISLIFSGSNIFCIDNLIRGRRSKKKDPGDIILGDDLSDYKL
ncbi:MAG: DoxX family protein [Nanoarchaeota archaeon]